MKKTNTKTYSKGGRGARWVRVDLSQRVDHTLNKGVSFVQVRYHNMGNWGYKMYNICWPALECPKHLRFDFL